MPTARPGSSAFRAFRTDLRNAWRRVTDPYVSIDVLLSWSTTRLSAVAVPMDERAVGQSNYTVRKLVKHMVNMLTGYSTRPLRMVTWLGFLSSLFGLAVLVFVVTRALLGDSDVPGFAFLSSLICILGGMQLFGLGSIALLVPLAFWGWHLIADKSVEDEKLRLICWLAGLVFAAGLAATCPVAARWPLAYARGNHDVRGPAARSLSRFTGTPDDRSASRSWPATAASR